MTGQMQALALARDMLSEEVLYTTVLARLYLNRCKAGELKTVENLFRPVAGQLKNIEHAGRKNVKTRLRLIYYKCPAGQVPMGRVPLAGVVWQSQKERK